MQKDLWAGDAFLCQPPRKQREKAIRRKTFGCFDENEELIQVRYKYQQRSYLECLPAMETVDPLQREAKKVE